MAKKLTLEDLIIEEHPGGQNCRSCPLMDSVTYSCAFPELNEDNTCLFNTITLKPTPDAHI